MLAEAAAEAAAARGKRAKAVEPPPRRGAFKATWRRTYADITAGYDRRRFMTQRGANLAVGGREHTKPRLRVGTPRHCHWRARTRATSVRKVDIRSKRHPFEKSFRMAGGTLAAAATAAGPAAAAGLDSDPCLVA